jgi:NAD(P)-dependent dehydrogenase (short-subunit alcohol dehydrogenase family)
MGRIGVDESNKVAVVTGAGTGVGRASALKLLAGGFDVFVVGRNIDRLQQVREQANGLPGVAHPVAVDITMAGEVRDLFNMINSHHGRLDLLFNNAGTGAKPVPPNELSVAEWDSVIATNLNGAFYCAREAFAIMRQQVPQGGRIINNGSISAHVPRPFSTPYTATKHAITGLTRSLSLDGRSFNIACGQIDIGNAATDMTARMVDGVLQADGTMRPEPRIDVEHVADAVVRMANLPLDVNIQFMTIMATTMPYIGRG